MAVNKPYMHRIDLVGYSDRPSACASEKINFTVSSEFETYKANLVRLIHGARSKPKCNILWGKMWHGKKLQPIEY